MDIDGGVSIADPEIIPDAAYNPDTDLIEIIGPGGQVFFSLSILGAAILEACITKAQTVGSMYRMKKNTNLDSGLNPE